jgi:proteasome lid subunit RPN8/RPN11
VREEVGQSWRVFGLELSSRLLARIRADAEARYPAEACGLGLGKPGAGEVDRLVPIKNVAEEPSTFAFDPREHMEALERADEEGRVERLVYHSHADAGAYLSAVDRVAIAPGGRAEQPDLIHIVVEVRHGVAGELAAFRFNPDTRDFDEAHPAPPSLPDLELRGGPSPRPIPPVGGRLASRRLGPWEAEGLATWAEDRQVIVDRETERLIGFFERGLLSPLTGFQRQDEARAVEALGRTPRGVEWRVPVVLELASAPSWPTGQVIRLTDAEGRGLALMVVADRATTSSGRVRIGGPIFCFPSGVADAWAVRAEWLSLDAKRILAVPAATRGWVREAVDLGSYDGFLVGGDESAASELGPSAKPLEEHAASPWLSAAMAQNLGATHFAVPEGVTRRELAALALTPVFPPS